MGSDPSSAFLKLQTALQPLFLWGIRNDKFLFVEIQQLKEAMDEYEKNIHNKNALIHLSHAISAALPFIEKRDMNFNLISEPMDALAKIHHLDTIKWKKVILEHPKVSSKFQFNTDQQESQEIKFADWIGQQVGKPFTELDHSELTQALVDHCDNHGFCEKLFAHLQEEPLFLFELIMGSEANFKKISSCVAILYIPDDKIAHAVLKHTPSLITEGVDFMEQTEKLVNKINEILTMGRSVSTILRSAEAKSILDHSKYFKVYQSEEFRNKDVAPVNTEKSKPILKPFQFFKTYNSEASGNKNRALDNNTDESPKP